MSELEPAKRQKQELEPRHIPQLVIAVPLADVREFMWDALKSTSIADPFAGALAGFVAFAPHVRYTAVDSTHTRIEIDLVGRVPGAETLMFPQRRAEIDRFFVAIQDELDRRAKWGPRRLTGGLDLY